MSTLLQDLRYSLRLLLKTPGFSVTAVLVLALGIGANAAIFTLVNTLLLKPLPGSEQPGQVVGIYSRDHTRPDSYRGFSYPAYTDIRDRANSFGEVSAFTLAFVGVGEADSTRRVFAAVATRGYFSTLGVNVRMGRTFTEEEERPGSNAQVAVVSDQYWKSQGSDPALLGKTVKVNARPFTIVGIAPPGFTGTSSLAGPEVWVPTGAHALVANDFMNESGPASLADRRSDHLMLIGRLRPGVSVEAAQPSLLALSEQLEKAYPAENKNQRLSVSPLSRNSISSSPHDDSELVAPFAILSAMAAIVLLIATLNLANMMLARGTARRKEIAIRLALGGGRSRIVRQLLTEGAVLSLLGGAGGLLLGYWSITLLVASFMPLAPVPLAFDGRPDIRVVSATLLFAVLSTVLFGLGPAWRLARTDVIGQIKEQAGEQPGRGRRRWFGGRNLLVVTQIALSLGLLIAAGLFVRGAIKAGNTDPGYRLDHQVLASLDTSLAGYDEARSRDLFRRLMERVRSMRGVQAASLASIVAFGDFSESQTVQKGGTPPGRGKDGRPVGTSAASYVVGSDYFRTLGVPVSRGRGFTLAEELDANAPPVAIIDEPLAKALFAGENPVGQRVQIASDEEGAPPGVGVVVHGPEQRTRVMEVVGVVAGLRHDLFDKGPVPHLYVPSGRNHRNWMILHVRQAGGDAAADAAMLQALRREIRAVDDRVPILALRTMVQHRDASLLYWMVKAGAQLFTVFGLVAVFLAIVGLYAVKAYVVARRTREIGIRMALGSTPGNVLWLVLKEGLGLTGAGLVTGVLLSLGVGQVVGSMLYEVSPFDPLVFALAPLLLALAALAACYLPARRATRIAPVVALRTE
jgi:predicted permease